jgi:hypothetical protein
LNQFLALFHFSIVLSLISNFIYASYSLPSQEPIATFLHILSAYFITIASGFLLLFIILLYKPENGFSKTAYQVLFLSFYFVLGLFFFLIPNGAKVEILPNGTQLYPVWNFTFFIYYLLIYLPNMALSLMLCFKIYKNINLKPLARRMKLFILGLCCIYYIGLGVACSNYFNDNMFRMIYTLTSVVSIVGVILIYYGVGTSLKHPFPL